MLSIVVAGVFHYKYYINRLSKSDDFDEICFSHKLDTFLEIPSNKRTNIFIKEYLLQLHIKMFGAKSAFKNISFYNWVWERFLSFNFEPADYNLVLLQGNNNSLLERISATDSCVVGEAVNVHPIAMKEIMAKDSLNHGVKFFWNDNIFQKKIKEIDLVDYLLVPSETVKLSYIKYGFPSSRIIKIPYGTEFAQTKTRTNPSNIMTDKTSIDILLVGQVFPRKGQYYLLRALEQFGGELPPINLKLIGLADKEYLKALKTFDIPFVHIPSLQHESVVQEMKSADLLILNSIEDGFGMVVSESMSVCTPVLVSKYAGSSELVSKYGGGLVHDPLDNRDTIDKIKQLIKGDYDEISTSLPSWDTYADSLLEKLKSLKA